MEIPFGKKFKLYKCENFQFHTYLKELGVDPPTRQALSAATVFDVKNGSVYTITESTTNTKQEIVFKLGEEFEEETQDGRKVISVITKDRNKLIQKQQGNKHTEIVREFSNNELKVTMKVTAIVCKKYFKLYYRLRSYIYPFPVHTMI